jgi:Ribbon-helix-helix protein, copG family
MPNSKKSRDSPLGIQMEQITISLPRYMMKELRERAAETSQPMDYIVRQALVEFFENLPRLPTKKF